MVLSINIFSAMADGVSLFVLLCTRTYSLWTSTTREYWESNDQPVLLLTHNYFLIVVFELYNCLYII